MTKTWMCGVAALAMTLVGCTSSTGLTKRVLDAQEDLTRFQCECGFAAGGYATVNECLTDRLLTNAERDCLVASYSPAIDMNKSHVDCIADAFEAFARCIRGHGCTISEAQVQACEAQHDPDVRCGSDDICHGLTGERRTDCLAEAARADRAADMCFPDED
ncbi:MAG: hypothetical protein KF901_21660 [Myxococcales bacterium]|nr:hypothetical protein [Myxococcales bacterium]